MLNDSHYAVYHAAIRLLVANGSDLDIEVVNMWIASNEKKLSRDSKESLRLLKAKSGRIKFDF
jgi:hypothetical protein